MRILGMALTHYPALVEAQGFEGDVLFPKENMESQERENRCVPASA